MNTQKAAEATNPKDLPMFFSPSVLKNEDITFFNEITKNPSQGLFPLSVNRYGDTWVMHIKHSEVTQHLIEGADCISENLRSIIITSAEAGYKRLIFDPEWLSALKQLAQP